MLTGGDIWGASSTTGKLVRQRRTVWGRLGSTIQPKKEHEQWCGKAEHGVCG